MVLLDFHQDLHHFGSTKSGSFERTPFGGRKESSETLDQGDS